MFPLLPWFHKRRLHSPEFIPKIALLHCPYPITTYQLPIYGMDTPYRYGISIPFL